MHTLYQLSGYPLTVDCICSRQCPSLLGYAVCSPDVLVAFASNAFFSAAFTDMDKITALL